MRRCHRKSGGKILQVRRCHRTSGGKILQVRRCHPNTASGSKAPSQNCRRSMQFGLGTPRMPMRGKLRYSFRCTLILSWVLVVWNKYPILPQRESWCSSAGGTVLQVLRLHSGHCGHCEKEGAVAWEIARGYCPTLLIWPAVWGFLHQDVSPAVWGFFKLMMFRLQFWDAFLIQNFSPAVSGWRLLNSRCFT